MRCKYIRKIFQNEENGYTVALFSTLNQEVPLSARDKFWAEKKIIAFTAKGYDLPLTDEIEIEMEGEWETSSYGTQYKVETFLEVVPRTREGILGYLSCGSLKGIGPKTAERIVNRFGLDTLEVMEKYPQELLKIQGISQQKLDRIVDSFGKNKVFRELMTFLSPFHVTPKKANMILQKFRDQSVEIIRKQPYILCAVKGFGFLTVDAIARQCCAATNDPMRISGCVSYVLREAILQIYLNYQESQKVYEQMEGFTQKIEDQDLSPEAVPGETPEEVAEQGVLQVDFNKLEEINPDVIAWIEIPGLEISYPVVQGRDNDYYLHHLITGENHKSGSIFMDFHNQEDLSDRNTIIYGHNMKDGSMFGTLDQYQSQALYRNYPCFYMYVPGYIYEYQIFSCYAAPTDYPAYTYDFPTSEDYEVFLETLQRSAEYNTGTTVTKEDQVVTLSTCVNTRKDYRYLVHGKLKQKIKMEE